MLSVRAFGTAAMLASLLFTPVPAEACRFLPTALHRVDPRLAEVDTAPPDAPTVVRVETYRRAGMTCSAEACVATTCGDTGTVRIELAPSAEETQPEQIGYRLQAAGGFVPPSIKGMLGIDLAGGAPLFLRPAFDEVPELELLLTAVAIDAAGNESAPSEPFRIEFDGCTLAAFGDVCTDDSRSEDVPLASAAPEPAAGLLPELDEHAAQCTAVVGSRATSADGRWALVMALGLVAGLRRRA